MVSSCHSLPWMMLVMFRLEYCRTRFQTLSTSPQVVSTMAHPVDSIFLRVPTSVPKAGMITTSSWVRPAICSGSGRLGRGRIPISRIWWLTSGLWMISPSRKIRFSSSK